MSEQTAVLQWTDWKTWRSDLSPWTILSHTQAETQSSLMLLPTLGFALLCWGTQKTTWGTSADSMLAHAFALGIEPAVVSSFHYLPSAWTSLSQSTGGVLLGAQETSLTSGFSGAAVWLCPPSKHSDAQRLSPLPETSPCHKRYSAVGKVCERTGCLWNSQQQQQKTGV